jgi:hypothetical protein
VCAYGVAPAGAVVVPLVDVLSVVPVVGVVVVWAGVVTVFAGVVTVVVGVVTVVCCVTVVGLTVVEWPMLSD